MLLLRCAPRRCSVLTLCFVQSMCCCIMSSITSITYTTHHTCTRMPLVGGAWVCLGLGRGGGWGGGGAGAGGMMARGHVNLGYEEWAQSYIMHRHLPRYVVLAATLLPQPPSSPCHSTPQPAPISKRLSPVAKPCRRPPDSSEIFFASLLFQKQVAFLLLVFVCVPACTLCFTNGPLLLVHAGD